jgi:outer membrane receptor protein involved in Fe transport
MSPRELVRTGQMLRLSALVLTCLSFLSARSRMGKLELQVTDPSGAPMEASGTIRNVGAGVAQKFRTDSRGKYTSLDLPYGRYRLELSQTGFANRSMLFDLHSPSVSKTVTMALGAVKYGVDVVSPTPLPGIDLEPNQVAAPVQRVDAQDLQQSGALELSDLLNRRLNSVNINENQGNPFQPDVNFRGYTASPLLGTPQGLSVYMDGVRLNQPFGDVVSWDLIPRNAISEVTLIPGSNPLFGLNTLGGAISIETKDGRSNPGTTLTLYGGSFGRKAAELEHGGSNSKGLSWFLAGNLFFEDGWRQYSPSDVRQFFGKLDWQNEMTSFGVTVGYANNALIGNALQDFRLLARDYTSVYTIPDITANRAPYLFLHGRHSFGSNVSMSGDAYYRYIRSATLNGDLNTDSLNQSVYNPSAADVSALLAAGYRNFPTTGLNAQNTPFPSLPCMAQALQRDEPEEKCNALLNRTLTQQQNYGFSGQVTWLGHIHSFANQFTAGAGYDGSISNFSQLSELGYLNSDRGVVGVGAFGDGVTGGSVNGVAFDTRVDLHGIVNTGSLYATDTLTAGRWNITLSGRFNRTTLNNHDRVNPLPGPGSLSAINTYTRFNPAAGFTYNLVRNLNTYFSYSEGNRAPTSIELGCADPTQPCRLPNALGGDPPLNQILTRTLEAGLRGGSEEDHFSWAAGWFRALNRDDILFAASTQTGFGYFKNFGRTLRQGAEISVNGRFWKLNLGGGYTFIGATYQSPETVNGFGNSTNDQALSGAPGMDGVIQIVPGDRLPLVPRHLLKAHAGFQATKKLSVDLGFHAASQSFARGNENNLSQPDGRYYLAPGISPGYGLMNLTANYEVHRHLELFTQINNVLDHRYYTAALIGPTGFTAQGTFIARPLAPINGDYPIPSATFYAPGAPIGAWVGLRIKF